VVQVIEEDLAKILGYTKAELILITLQRFSNVCTSKSRSSLHRLTLGILLSFLACGESRSNLPAGDLIEPEDFIETYVDLRAAALITEDGQVTEAGRSEVLDRHGISEEDLISFTQAYGEDLMFMQELWNEIELRLENTRSSPDTMN
jgi:hypothetical protein